MNIIIVQSAYSQFFFAMYFDLLSDVSNFVDQVTKLYLALAINILMTIMTC